MNSPLNRLLCTVLILCASSASLARLEFDSKANKVELYGPYIKYNILKEPYSFGRFQFSLDDINVELEFPEGKTSSETEPNIYVKWPRFLLSFGRVRFITRKGRVVLEDRFMEEHVGADEKFSRLYLEDEGSELLKSLQENFQVCVDQAFEDSYVKACSDYLIYKDGHLKKGFSGKNAASAKLNGKKAPKNAQISLDKNMQKVQVSIKFKSGYQMTVKDKVRELKIENLAIDPKEKRLGVISGDGSVRPIRLTLKDRFFTFIKETNYFKNRYANSSDWPQNLEDAEMEFAPFLTGGSVQLYGIIVPLAPPPFDFKLNDDIPIATYSDHLELRGTKLESEVLAAKQKNELFIHDNNTEFLWNFPAPNSGQVNQNYISLKHKNKDYYFSKRIFRAHNTNVAASAAISTSTTLDIVPGYNFSADHWFEHIWGRRKYSFQHWGIAANLYSTAQAFETKKDHVNGVDDRISVLPVNFDLLYRFTPGVRPVQSSFGVGLRYLNFTLFRSINDDIEARFVGIGGFWHTAPQKIIDDIFNIIPFFRYPKWMEISFFYYPLILGGDQAGFSFSWQAKGKLFFSRRMYMDASFNVNAISFTSSTVGTTRTINNNFSIGTAHGTIGLGVIF